MQAETLAGGFTTPAVQSAAAFRAMMNATARPGTIETITGATPPAPLSPAAGAVILTLCDTDTPLYLAGGLDTDAVRKWVAFHTGAPIVGPSHCMFAIGGWDALGPLSQYAIGTSEYPDRAATLIVELDDLTAEGATLSGPGIKTTATLSLPETTAFRDNHGHFPLGLDFMFTCGDRIAGLPRSTEVR